MAEAGYITLQHVQVNIIQLRIVTGDSLSVGTACWVEGISVYINGIKWPSHRLPPNRDKPSRETCNSVALDKKDRYPRFQDIWSKERCDRGKKREWQVA
jgi:hypothetical protein